MIHINGKSKSALTNVQEQDVQPNATDLRVKKILEIGTKRFCVSEEGKQHRGSKEIKPNADGVWILDPGAYEIVMENTINVAEGEAGFVITRSTLNRNGVYLTSGLYDSGYHGIMAAVMHVTQGIMEITKGTRVGQYINFRAETLHQYNGSYGLDAEHDKKYND